MSSTTVPSSDKPKLNLSYRLASKDDLNVLHKILNESYRSDKCWTNEANLVAGERITLPELETLLNGMKEQKDSFSKPLIVADLEHEGGKKELIGCIQAEKCPKFMANEADEKLPPIEYETYLGLFAVNHEYQSRGVGKFLMNSAVAYGKNVWKTKTSVVFVINSRTELQAWYTRMGYEDTGIRRDFPKDVYKPKVDEIFFVVYRKQL